MPLLFLWLLFPWLDRCVGSCNTLNDLSNKVCISNQTEDLNLSVLNMIARINKSETLTKQISCECKCKFYLKCGWNEIQIVFFKKCNSNQKWNRKKHHICEKDYIWNPAACSCNNGKYLASITDNSVITCDKK